MPDAPAPDHLPTSMPAIAVRAFRSEPELMELPVPSPGSNELLVRIAAAGLNPFDWKIADGILHPARPHLFPLVLGVDGAGTVEAIGERVRGWSKGDRVVGSFLHNPVGTGTYAGFALVPESNPVVRWHDGLDLVEAAALPTAGLTALDAIDRIGPRTGSTVLVVGASGGVGTFATSIAAARGARVVGTSRPEVSRLVREAGAAETIDPSARAVDVRRQYPGGFDGLLDVVHEGADFAAFAALVRPGGVAVTTRYTANVEALSAAGIVGVNIDVHPTAKGLASLLDLIVGGRLKAPPAGRRMLRDAPSLLRESRAGTLRGKIVLIP